MSSFYTVDLPATIVCNSSPVGCSKTPQLDPVRLYSQPELTLRPQKSWALLVQKLALSRGVWLPS